jgi:hypothetical protein
MMFSMFTRQAPESAHRGYQSASSSSMYRWTLFPWNLSLRLFRWSFAWLLVGLPVNTTRRSKGSHEERHAGHSAANYSVTKRS